MKIKGFLNEKGRIYIPAKIRTMFNPEPLFKKHKFYTWDRGESKSYYNWIIERVIAELPLKPIEHKSSDSYKKHNWGNSLILGVIKPTKLSNNKGGFLIIYSPRMHHAVEKFLGFGVDSDKKDPFKLDKPTLMKLDRAGKITIPKSYRRDVYIDYLLKSKTTYVEREILMIKRMFILEIWNPRLWSAAPDDAKRLFDDSFAESVFEQLRYEARIPFLPG